MDEQMLKDLIRNASKDDLSVGALLERSSKGEVSLKHIAAALRFKHLIADELTKTAAEINKKLFCKEIEFYAVSYISDHCVNRCSYCGYNAELGHCRQTLAPDEMAKDLCAVLKHGANDLCILYGEHPTIIPELLALAGNIAIECDLLHALDRITFNIAPMDAKGFQRLRNGIKFPLQYRIFQESYDKKTYVENHTKGPKSNFEFRLGAQKRALQAGFDEVGLGVLLGLNRENESYRNFGNDFEILALIAHAYALKQECGKLPFSISLPRLQSAEGSSFLIPNPVDDDTYVLYHAILKLALPGTRTIITRRETKEMLDRLRPLIDIEDLATKPGVGGNFREESHFQNELGDPRELPEILAGLRAQGYIPKIKA